MERDRAADAALHETVRVALERSRALIADSAELLEITRSLRAQIIDLKGARVAARTPDAPPE